MAEAEERERAFVIGPIQAALIERALGSRLLFCVPADWREARSARALVRRGIMERPPGWHFAYRMTMLGCEMMSGGKSG